MSDEYRHRPVMLAEILAHLQPQRNQHFIDGTLGGGGHAAELLALNGPAGKVLGFELDPRAREAATKHCAEYGSRLVILPQSYATLGQAIEAHPEFRDAHGALLDLGLSSDQLDASGRGFSFRDSGDLDMRFDPQTGETAAAFLTAASEEEIRDVLRRFGEIKEAARIARAIVRLRASLLPTESLTVPAVVAVIVAEIHRPKPGIHPATQVFQALRIQVNQELANVALALPQLVDVVASGGRIAVISYHSLEDRIVKEFFRREARDCLCPPGIPVCRCGHTATLRIITKKPLRPSQQEITENPRSRSARLRVAEKI